jgi:hypothetical protein
VKLGLLSGVVALSVGLASFVPRSGAAQPAMPRDAAHAGGGMVPQGPEPNREEPTTELPAGTVEAVLVDGEERPLAGADVRLGILFQKIAEGESRSSKTGKTSAEGRARFDGLETGSNFAYRVTAKRGEAEYSSSPFNLRDVGVRVLLHVFPVTSNPSEAVVGLRGYFYVETRDDVFQVETLFRVFNLSKVAWVPKDVVMTLPAGFKAFNAGDPMTDARFEMVDGKGAKLLGTYPPGQHDVSFRFQVPKEASTTASFDVKPPPRTAEMRVIAVTNKSMGLEVEGFEQPREDRGPRGDRVLVTRKVVARGEPEVGSFRIVLTGLPAPDAGRWVAAFIALAFASFGGLAAAGKLKPVSTERLESDRARARDLLFEELLTLDQARKNGEIGPIAHERAHRMLVDALARIGLPREKKRKKRARTVEA